MDLNLETLQQCCRGCLQKGDINIWNFKVKLDQENNENFQHMGDSMDFSILQLMDIFNNSKNDILNLSEEFPLLCWQCLEDLKFCYMFCEKLKLANIQLKNLYQETFNQCIDEEHLIEPIEEHIEIDGEQEMVEIIDINSIENYQELQETSADTIPVEEKNVEHDKLISLKIQTRDNLTNNRSKKIPLEKNSAVIITQFVPSTLETPQRSISDPSKPSEEEQEEFPQLPQHLLTMDYKLVEVKDLSNLESVETSADSLQNPDDSPAVYICQYCPQAFAKSEYLKTHIQKSHVCKFCTQPFILTEDLFKHIREVHTEHKCAICSKILSSNTNLRHHIRRMHRINLPAKVALIDYIKPTDVLEENTSIIEKVVDLPKETEVENFDVNLDYLWKTNDCIEMLSENNMDIN